MDAAEQSPLIASPPDGGSTFADRVIGAAITLVAVYLAATLWPMGRHVQNGGDVWPLAVHASLLLTALFARSSPAGVRPLRDLYPLAVGAYLYVELRWLIAGMGRPHADALVQRWEQLVFPGDPSATWAPAMPNAALSELLHFAYLSYYFVVLVPPLVLYLRGRRDAYAQTMLAIVIVYAVCFTSYLFFPVDGPRFLHGPAAAPDGPMRRFVVRLLAAGSSRGTAFPSSHIAAAVVASLCALRFQRRLGAAVAALTVGLALGTVYGGFHYAVDGLVGVGVGLVSYSVAALVWRALSTPLQQRATAT